MVVVLIMFWRRWGWLTADTHFLVGRHLRRRGINERLKYQKNRLLKR
jgi:hypothetical protein